MEKPSAPFQPVLERTLAHSLAYLDGLEHSSVAATASLAELRTALNRPLNDTGIDARQVIDDLVADAARGLHGCAGGRFFGWVIGGSVPAALAADWLTSVWDQNAALHACGPSAAVVEEVCGHWLKDLMGLPKTSGFALTTGTSMAHFTCLNAARHAVLAARDWNVERRGLCGAPRIRVLSGSERHGSVDRAVQLLGLGRDSIVELPVDTHGVVRADVLQNELTLDPAAATIVVLQAGDLCIGAFDSFSELIPLARQHNAWVHIDGAFGLWIAASPTHRHMVKDVQLADSWTVDGHKWLNVPYDCGYAFVADSEVHRASMSLRASYLVHDDDARDQIDWNPEWSRRGRGFATYAAIRQLGRKGIADLIDRTCHHALSIVRRIGALDGAEIMWAPRINQGLVRFLDRRPGATEADHDRRTDDVTAAILKTGEAFFSNTTWRGRRCMRVSVVSWQTSDADVDRVVAAVEKVLGAKST
jgi:glutamate/tyrosine decarboxylase-like PLP-dependent enzyme